MKITRTFVRTPDTGNGEGLPMDGYIAHSVPSIRHAPDGVTFDQIMQDHVGQAAVDEEAPLSEHEVAFHLVRCIEAGLIGVLETRPRAGVRRLREEPDPEQAGVLFLYDPDAAYDTSRDVNGVMFTRPAHGPGEMLVSCHPPTAARIALWYDLMKRPWCEDEYHDHHPPYTRSSREPDGRGTERSGGAGSVPG